MTYHLELFCFRLERQREDILRGRLIRSDIMAMIMIEKTRLNGSRSDTPTRRESNRSQAAESGQERKARIKNEHNV